jgi:hypothetical protein
MMVVNSGFHSKRKFIKLYILFNNAVKSFDFVAFYAGAGIAQLV